jgi:hypothetical protein
MELLSIYEENSVQFDGHLLTCRLNSTSVYCEVNTKTQIKHKIDKTHRNKTLNNQNNKYDTKIDIKY